jgi:hypothetical protein
MTTSKVELSVDKFLKEQVTNTLRATIESTANEATVKVTPWIQEAGCQCNRALEISKNLIDKVVPTGDTHPCRGKVLRVVEVHFKQGSTLPIAEFFKAQGQKKPPDSGDTHDFVRPVVQRRHLGGRPCIYVGEDGCPCGCLGADGNYYCCTCCVG